MKLKNMHSITRFIFAAGCAASLTAGHARGAVRYTALGASDAVGVGSSAYPTQPNGGYVFRISDWLQARYSPWTLHNLGVSGYTAPDIRDHTLAPAIADAPDMVTLWVGGDDIKDSVLQNESTEALKTRFEAAYTTIISRLRTETNATVVTANLPDLSRIPAAAWFPDSYKALATADTNALNEVIARVAAQYGVPVVDLFSLAASYDPANFSSDGFHPNDAGYAAMAEQFEAALKVNAWRRVSGLGDVNGDANITASDAVATLEIAAGLRPADDRQAVASDTFPAGGDGVVDISDALQTLRCSYGLVAGADWG
jgi:lysophospholipase L1-like esterase